MRAARPFQQIGHFGGGERVGLLVVHLQNHVAGAKPGLIGRRSAERRDHDGLAVARGHLHPDAVVVSALIVAERLKILGIEEIGVRIKRPQHARNRALVDALVGGDLVGEIVLHQLVHFGELLDVGLEVFLGTAGGRRNTGNTRSKDAPQDGAENDDESGKEGRTVPNAASTPRSFSIPEFSWLGRYRLLARLGYGREVRLGASNRPARPGRSRFGLHRLALGESSRRRTWSLTQTRNMGCLAFFRMSMIRSCWSSR